MMNTKGNERNSASSSNARRDRQVAEVEDERQLELVSDDETKVEEEGGEVQEESKEDHKEETIISVKTKTEDGGAQATTEGNLQDAFSQYSNTNVRMMHLLGLDEDEGGANEDNTEWRDLTGYRGLWSLREEAANNAQVNARKTRLSTELHGEVFIELMFGNGQE